VQCSAVQYSAVQCTESERVTSDRGSQLGGDAQIMESLRGKPGLAGQVTCSSMTTMQ
jgi:hypothetical protein